MRISLNDKSITWKEFRERYAKFFPISYEPKRLEAMAKEYEKQTGRKAEDEKISKRETGRPKINNRPTEINNSRSNAKEDFAEPKG